MAKSHWGWGEADRFPDRDSRKMIGESAQMVLGFAPTTLEDPAPLEAVELPAPKLSPPPSLQHQFLPGKEARVTHTYGRSYRDIIRGFRGDFGSAPDLVARPQSSQDVRRILDWASAHRVAVVPFGGGTSVVSGVECTPADRAHADVGAVVSLDLGAMGTVTDVDPVSRLARIEAGVTGPALERQLSDHGLTLRHFPQSFEYSTLGGWLATRAGGHFATLYTHIDELTSSIEMLSPSGDLRTRTLPGSGAGPSPDRLILGSEGALGVITAATVRVRPRPRFKANATAVFPRFAEAVAAAWRLAQSDLHPSNCRVLDEREAALNGVDGAGRAVLIVAFESDDHPLEPWMSRAVEIVETSGGALQSPVRYVTPGGSSSRTQGSDQWRSRFMDAPYLQTQFVSLGVLLDTFETACPWSSFESLDGELRETLNRVMHKVAGAGFLTCRFTHVYPDGPAPYYTFGCPGRVGEELKQWEEIKAAASEVLMRHGATITHHHAVGRTHRPWYEQQVPKPFLEALTAAKASLDPAAILNPGALVPIRPRS